MWRNIIYISFLSFILIGSFYLLYVPDFAITTSLSADSSYFLNHLISSQRYSSVAMVLLGVLGLIYLKIIWHLINYYPSK